MNYSLLKNWLLVLLISIGFISCLGDSSSVANPSSDASIKGISILKNDSSPNASSAVFTIDNVLNQIYNIDSLPFGTKIDSLYLSLTFGSSLGFIMNDSISESNYLSTTTTKNAYNFTAPVKIKNLATDGETTKEYVIDVRVHKVETYLHTWTKLNSNITSDVSDNQKAVLYKNNFYFFVEKNDVINLFTSTDAINWTNKNTVKGLPNKIVLKHLLATDNSLYLIGNDNDMYISADGENWENQNIVGSSEYDYAALLFFFKGKIWGIAKSKTDFSVRIVSSTDGINWEFSGKKNFHNDFPVKDFAATVFQPQIGPEKVIVLGGKSSFNSDLTTIWSAENILNSDTLKWLNINNTGKNIPAMKNGALEYYGSKLLLFGGSSNTLLIDTIPLRNSLNEGVNWILPDTLINKVPADFIYRTQTSLINDRQNKNLYVIGGKSKNANLSDVWRIRVNFYSFKDYLENPYKY